ncbi:MAG TPA: HlyD family efflux transporter periplasmic adaptor subunit [Polyangia bacterium]|nr:HlyD family efflux transporter periplasmic adaptor subunit [Polyangia bacterium]
MAAGTALALLGAGCSGARAGRAEPLQGVVEFDQAAIGFDVAGRVARVEVKRGDTVAAAAPLAQLDDALSRLQRDMREADVRAARAQLALLRAGSRPEDVRAADAELVAARTQEEVVRRSLARQQELVGRGAAPSATLDDWTGQLARWEAERRAREERLRVMRKGARVEEIMAAQARVAAAESALEFESARLARHVIAAPRAGAVIDVHVEPGEVVAAGAPVVTLADTAHPYVDVFVPQARLGGIRVGAPARVRVDAERASLPGRVEDLGRRTEFTPRFLFSERERPNLVVRVRVRVEDPEGRLHAGVPAFVELE